MEIKRPELLSQLIARKGNGIVKIVTGMRRVGKSYLLNQLFTQSLMADGVESEHILQYDLEDYLQKDFCQPDIILQDIFNRTKDENTYYVIIDEVQNLRDFEAVLNTLLKRYHYDVYVTGSNSRFLSKDVITEFRGRGDEVKVHPLSFKEFASARVDLTFYQQLYEYMQFGGLPQIATFEQETLRKNYLTQLFQNTYFLDIKERNKIRNDADLEELVDVLASSIGSLTNPLKIQNTFRSTKKSNISYDTIKSYLDILQDAFLIEPSKRYDIKGRHYINSQQKYYFTDLGLRNARLGFRQMEPTHQFENLIYNELRVLGYSVDVGSVEQVTRQEGKPERRNYEVDFVCNEGYNRLYIQAAYSLQTPEKWEQELHSLRHISENFQKIVISGDLLQPTYRNQEGFLILNISDFLLKGISPFL